MINIEVKIAAAYVRVSTDDQLEYSPDSQIKAVREYAKREGYIIPDEYVFQDDGISGKSAQKRPAFRLMIATAKQEPAPFSAIFVWKYSRFARNQEEAIMYKNLLRKKGIDVKSISEPSSDSPFASLIERIIEWMDEYYVINLAEEVKRGMAEKAKRGEAMGTAPFGYTVKDKSFVQNEHADTVRYIFDRYISGDGFKKIATDLGDRGIRTRRGNRPDNRWVQYILSNPVYIGKIRWSENGKALYCRSGFSGDNIIVSDGSHEPIIDGETWNAAQEKLKSRDTEKYRRKSEFVDNFMLRGLCRCSSCGSTLVRSRGTYMQCCSYNRGTCRESHFLRMDAADAAVIDVLEKCLGDCTFTFTPAKKTTKKIEYDWDGLIASERTKLVRAKDALLSGAFSVDEYKEIKAAVDQTINSLLAGKKNDENQTSRPDTRLLVKKTSSVLDLIKSPDVPVVEKNRALRSIIDRIVFDKKNNTFSIFFAP